MQGQKNKKTIKKAKMGTITHDKAFQIYISVPVEVT